MSVCKQFRSSRAIRKTKEEAALTRESVLQAALRVFSRQGYAASTLEDIAREAGVTRGAIYWHFQGKAELYQTLLAQGSQKPLQLLDEVSSAALSPTEMLRRLFIRLLEDIEEDETFQAITELTLFKSEPGIVDAQGEGLAQKYQGTQAFAQQLAQILHRGIDAGELRADLDIQVTSLAFTALLNGVLLVWLQSAKTFSLKLFAPSLADTYLQGILASS
ncbi:TetR family transcriptional regulator [Ktedonosporobacter rubrisoli]|uniref:TetR family transcriptional regulator n=1 Tax=Ktedonosporobacter rubrisoli TaxID=2509675 RepID=A0A4P6JMB1_KTERU|nr:TetR family transcriptional regulator [Ktedonosporobacter rubrisoli]QBD76388.1 TetR family transcriptional regulator [Ktedonosporobacter rubrisoli]